MFGDILIRVLDANGNVIREETLSYKAAVAMANLEWSDALGPVELRYFCATSGMELNRMAEDREIVGFCGIPNSFYQRPIQETLH